MVQNIRDVKERFSRLLEDELDKVKERVLIKLQNEKEKVKKTKEIEKRNCESDRDVKLIEKKQKLMLSNRECNIENRWIRYNQNRHSSKGMNNE